LRSPAAANFDLDKSITIPGQLSWAVSSKQRQSLRHTSYGTKMPGGAEATHHGPPEKHHGAEETMGKKMDPVIHFELPADDPEHLREFYETVFGWQTTPLGPEMGNFVLAFTSETDAETRMPKKRGFINGGFYRRTAPNEHVKLTVLVDDIREAMKTIEASGGKVLGEPFEMPGVGLFVDFVDPAGNRGTINQDFAVKRL
jgi:uncharacterized protein